MPTLTLDPAVLAGAELDQFTGHAMRDTPSMFARDLIPELPCMSTADALILTPLGVFAQTVERAIATQCDHPGSQLIMIAGPLAPQAR